MPELKIKVAVDKIKSKEKFLKSCKTGIKFMDCIILFLQSKSSGCNINMLYGKIEEVENMEGARVKILVLSIRGLYDYYDYMIDFNTDVTFIYGMNGCGKTTILNITEAIITGQLFKLFNYRFKEISLKYAGNSNLDDVKEISIHLVKHKHEIVIEFESGHYRLQTLGIENISHQRRNNAAHIASEYFHRYSFLKVIRDTFNYVYLPLNRSFASSDDFEDMFIYDRRFRNGSLMDDDAFLEMDDRDGAMIKIESLVYRQYSKANAAINRISDSFRNSMLKQQIELY